jgi:hypothetical protein
VACYRHRPCYSGPMRQSRAHQRTSRFRLYRWPRGQETFPVLHPRPCDRATAHTPESSRGAFARLFPRDPAFAVITPVQRSRFPAAAFSRGRLSTLQRFHHVAARSLARPPGQPRLATARALSSELSSRWSPNPNVRFATWLSGFYHDRSFPGWFGMFTGCTLSPPSLLLRPHAPVSWPPTSFPGALVMSSASRSRHLPRFDHIPFGGRRHPYAGRPVACMHPTSSATALAIVQQRGTWHLHYPLWR